MHRRLKQLKRIGMTLVVPIIFLVVGYSLLYVVGRPIIQFTTSSLQIFLLMDVPKHSEVDKETHSQMNFDESENNTNANKKLASSEVDYPRGGYQYGQVKVEQLDLNVPLYYGDTNEILRYGAGQYMGSVYPGELGTTMIGGHNADGFGRLIGVQKQMPIVIKTTYGQYQYRVLWFDVRNKEDKEIQKLLLQRKKPLLILYTCYPIDSIGLTDERLFVICELIEGPIIDPAK